MRRYKIILIILIVCSLIAFSSLPVEASSIQKFITAYDFSDADIPFISSHFNFIDTYLDKAIQVQKIKNTNSYFKAILYKDALTHRGIVREDWYIKDTQTGSRLVNKDWGWYLMDIGSPGYVISLTNFIKNNLAENPVFDGVFLDDVWGSVSSNRFVKEGTKEQAILSPQVIKHWRENMKLLLNQIKTAIGKKLLIINTGAFNTDYLSIADGQMYEAFCHANWEPFGKYDPGWQKVLDTMNTISASEKLFLAQSGILDGATDSQIKRTQKYCFSMFLLGANSNSYFYFKPGMRYRGVTYFPEWDVDLGAPSGSYHPRVGTPLYEREYSKALVLINPSSEGFQINLGSEYKNLDGLVVDRISLESHEGEILLKTVTEKN